MATAQDRPQASSAEMHILCNGYTGQRSPSPIGAYRLDVGSTVGFVREGDVRVIIDPGMVAAPADILEPLAALGESPATISDVIFSHHHPDHTLNAALFPFARFHDHWAIYQGNSWISRRAEGFDVAPSIRLIETPGHSLQDITTLVGTPSGVIAFTHLWWSASGPLEDPSTPDAALLHANRQRILQIASLIVPGHGAPFIPDEKTPR